MVRHPDLARRVAIASTAMGEHPPLYLWAGAPQRALADGRIAHLRDGATKRRSSTISDRPRWSYIWLDVIFLERHMLLQMPIHLAAFPLVQVDGLAGGAVV